MNIPTIARNTSAVWLRRGIAIVGALLISGAVALSLAHHVTINVAPAAGAAAGVSAAQERFAALKQAQAEARDHTFVPAPVVTSGQERFAVLKERQAELRDTTFGAAPAQATGRERFAALKQTQAELREAGIR